MVRPHSVVLSRTAADRYFGGAALALNKTLKVNAYFEDSFTVTGVMEDFPANTHFHFNALLSIDYSREKFNPDNWLSHSPFTYVLLPEETTSPLAVEARIREMTERILNPIYKSRFGKTYEEQKQLGGLQEYRLQPLTDVHLYSFIHQFIPHKTLATRIIPVHWVSTLRWDTSSLLALPEKTSKSSLTKRRSVLLAGKTEQPTTSSAK